MTVNKSTIFGDQFLDPNYSWGGLTRTQQIRMHEMGIDPRAMGSSDPLVEAKRWAAVFEVTNPELEELGIENYSFLNDDYAKVVENYKKMFPNHPELHGKVEHGTTVTSENSVATEGVFTNREFLEFLSKNADRLDHSPLVSGFSKKDLIGAAEEFYGAAKLQQMGIDSAELEERAKVFKKTHSGKDASPSGSHWVGVGTGAAIGTLIAPGIGTVIGGLVGLIAGEALDGVSKKDVDLALKANDKKWDKLNQPEFLEYLHTNKKNLDNSWFTQGLDKDDLVSAVKRFYGDEAVKEMGYSDADLEEWAKSFTKANKTNVNNVSNSMLVAGGTGAAIGTLICPGIGTAIGAAIGVIGGYIFDDGDQGVTEKDLAYTRALT